MILQEIYLNIYDWVLKIYYVDEEYPINLILEDLYKLDCEYIDDIKKLMYSNEMNSGFTYTNKNTTIIVIGPTQNVVEFANTFDHEKGHAVTHICQYYNIDPYGEEKQYLAGKIAEETFEVARRFLCKPCN